MGSFSKEQLTVDPISGLAIGPLVTLPEARWPAPVTLTGRSICIEPLNPITHSDALWQVTGGMKHAELWQYMSEGPFFSRSEFDASLASAAASQDPVFFALIDQQTGLAVGRCSYLNIRPAHGVIEVGNLLFSHLLQRKRGATEALYLMAKHAFVDLGYRRYEWKCNALNEKSRKAALRTGFTFEGVFRQHMIIKGRSRDSAWFSILDSEWPSVCLAFETWLAPENFDANGNQRHPLNLS